MWRPETMDAAGLFHWVHCSDHRLDAAQVADEAHCLGDPSVRIGTTEVQLTTSWLQLLRFAWRITPLGPSL